ncbi:ATP-binding protein [Streptomyces sp. 205]|uniref:ATP-binding protein n=1 Tax=Streptomyces coffeae TaxID=621382 RepID=A0ABS1NN32_9ACTN|nr:ATP-binding protein [Streptomyces coffeae]
MLADWVICSECADRSQLLVSELVTNAVTHGCGPIQLSVTREWSAGSPCALRISVADTSPKPASKRQAAAFDEHGRGLTLVNVLADRWGQESLGEGKRIWVEVGRFCSEEALPEALRRNVAQTQKGSELANQGKVKRLPVGERKDGDEKAGKSAKAQLEQLSKAELYEQATKLAIPARSEMNPHQLIQALAKAAS